MARSLSGQRWQCQIHAREWISGAVCQYLVDHLVNNYRVDPEITALLDTVELIVVPFVNPDGYVFTWSDSRLWRKNREPNPGSSCVGTDLNRNYADHWGEGGGSTNPCSETYEGSRAFSGTEAAQTSQYFSANAPILGAIDWHAYSQLMLRPWGWTQADAPDERLMKECGDRFRDDVAKARPSAAHPRLPEAPGTLDCRNVACGARRRCPWLANWRIACNRW